MTPILQTERTQDEREKKPSTMLPGAHLQARDANSVREILLWGDARYGLAQAIQVEWSIEEMNEERDQLKGRISELTDAIGQKDVQTEEFVRMSKQLGAMRQYLMYLDMRISNVLGTTG